MNTHVCCLNQQAILGIFPVSDYFEKWDGSANKKSEC